LFKERRMSIMEVGFRTVVLMVTATFAAVPDHLDVLLALLGL